MKMISKILVLLLLAILISGCGVSSRFFKGRGDNIDTYKFRSGTEGVAISFVAGMPPDSVYTDTDFSVGVQLENKGAFNVDDRAEIKISVPDSEAFEFGGSGNQDIFTLAGKSLYVKEGQQDVKTFPMKSKCIPFGSFRKNYTANIQASVCYYYETQAQADICVDTLHYKRQKGDKKECDMKPMSLSGGQGGPVGVTTIPIPQIIESGDSTTVQVSIPIQKLLSGHVSIYHPDNQCTDPKKLNNISVEVSLGGKVMDCKPKDLVLRESSPTSVVCSVKVDSAAGAYITPVLVKMKYYVQEKIIKSLKIDPPPGQKAASVDCKPDIATSSGSTDKCSSSNPGYNCRDISGVCPNAEDSCVTAQGCKKGLCPGGATNVCCP